jgi:hypothetical protein
VLHTIYINVRIIYIAQVLLYKVNSLERKKTVYIMYVCVESISMNTYSNRRVANHLHGLIFELKERMNSRQDRPVMRVFTCMSLTYVYKKSFKKVCIYEHAQNAFAVCKHTLKALC